MTRCPKKLILFDWIYIGIRWHRFSLVPLCNGLSDPHSRIEEVGLRFGGDDWHRTVGCGRVVVMRDRRGEVILWVRSGGCEEGCDRGLEATAFSCVGRSD